MRTPASRPILALIPLLLVLACDGGATDAPQSAPTATTPAATPGATSTATAAKKAPRRPGERPLPAFQGKAFDGKEIAVSDFLGQRLVIFFFRPEDAAARPAMAAVKTLSTLQGEHNFRILGVASGATSAEALARIEARRFDFPILNDASGGIAKRFGLDIPAALLFADAEGYVTGAMGGVAEGSDDAKASVEARAREALRLPPLSAPLLEPGLGEYPQAPDFSSVTLDGQKVGLSDLRGRTSVLIFFLYTCPHCHHALAFLKEHVASLPDAERPALLGISVAGDTAAVRSELESKGLDFLRVASDPDRSIAQRYGVVGGVPDILLLDAEGRIRARTQGWRDDRDPALMRMRLARIAGRSVPMLLHAKGYSGNEFCGVCHENEAETWRFTQHAQAFDTLVRHAAERDAECVSCHVVGFEQTGGYSLAAPIHELEDVGCETCHGRGGPHLSPNRIAGNDYAAVCATCHDAKHSLGFDYATFLPKVSHAANAHLLALPAAEKQTLLSDLGSTRKPLFPEADLVGSDACQSCHSAEFATWEEGVHGRAIHSLAKKGKARDAACQKCHTTGLGQTGGFPAGGDPVAHPDLARVGCESCHGPGGNHVAEGARRDGTIVSLGDKCDSCVILQICGECHDQENDPGFDFRVQEKIDAQRHGTIQPSIERSGAPQAQLDSLAARIGAVEHALAAGGR